VTAAAGVPARDAAIRAGSKSFALASQLFDEETRGRVWDLYAWCRHLDDVTDGQVLGHGRTEVADRAARVADLRRRSERALRGKTGDGPAFDGLARVAATTGLPARYVHDHLEGFEMDASGRRYVSLDDTLSYCYHVAGAVGLMMAWIMGVREADTLLRGCDLGVAFQLTNIARDVGEDAGAGRVYLPEAWLREHGADLASGRPPDAATRERLAPVVARLLDEADRYYASAWHGVPRLPWRSAWAVATARHVYRDIGVEVRRRGARAWDGRVVVGGGRKLARLAQALGEATWAAAARRRDAAVPRTGLWTPPGGGHARMTA